MTADDIESVFDGAMEGVTGPCVTRVAFAMDRLQATEGRGDVIPIAELAERLSLVLGRNVTAEEFMKYAEREPANDDVIQAMARVLEVDPEWLRGSAGRD